MIELEVMTQPMRTQYYLIGENTQAFCNNELIIEDFAMITYRLYETEIDYKEMDHPGPSNTFQF